jgi:hypothetical protein
MGTDESQRRNAAAGPALGRAILGGFVSYMELQTLLNQRARHSQFERLANSDVVKQEQNSWPLTLRYKPDRAIETFRRLSENEQQGVFDRLTSEEQGDLIAKLKCEPLPSGYPSTATTGENLLKIPNHPGYHLDVKDDPYACSADTGDPPISTMNEGGIKAIHWTKTLGAESIETEDGQTIYPTPAPSAWLYLLIALFPVLGLFIPWGAIRAIGWVGAGFVASPK